jgi:methylmalonyl-CoA/ethylmalonyl-CoA epimerase
MEPDARVTLGRIGQIALTIQDGARARAFYQNVLGLRHLFDAPPGMSFFDCAGVRLLLGTAEGDAAEVQSSSVLYFDVSDIQAAHDQLAARGAQFVQPPHRVADLGDRDLWLAFFRDGEGNTLALMSEVRKQDAAG